MDNEGIEINLTNGEWYLVGWMIQNLTGLDEAGAMIVANIEDVFKLLDQPELSRRDWKKECASNPFSTTRQIYEQILTWLNATFKGEMVPAVLARHSLSLKKKLMNIVIED